MYFCVLRHKITLTVTCHVPISHKITLNSDLSRTILSQNNTYSDLSRTILSKNQIPTLYQYLQSILYTNIN
jgi:hypothetical protein